jgi:hypothetical protein
VEPVELGADARPGASGGGFGDADEQQGQPAEQDVGADALFAAVVDRPQVDDLFQVAPAAFDLQELPCCLMSIGPRRPLRCLIQKGPVDRRQ